MTSRVDHGKEDAAPLRLTNCHEHAAVRVRAFSRGHASRDDELSERSLPLDGLLAEVCLHWYRAEAPIPDAGVLGCCDGKACLTP
ncbi:hypothetical protein [Candidatus Poriferisodalis sp.]|uniref:hypothetical protein n=1 Tax=Candidatus Poriferisodalis sp. TaxID=3101277 RepID=UPI003B51DCA6